ncbi:MAG: mechanosensitive ion channel [Deinococcus-Thermus bacterium]|jgi:small conductance mechanosensitive channel|nr:mechanosensitive ion channel [Deinococcota bacterium]
MNAPDLADLALGLAVDVVAAIVILLVGWLIAGWASGAVRRAGERSDRFDRTLTSVFVRLVRWGILAITLVAVLGRFGVQTTSIIAVLGAAGLAIGLALQGALSNVAAGVMILGLRPFRLGDAVDIGGTLGTVDEIGLFATKLTTFDGVVVHQPNSNIWGSEIKNYSQAQLRRVDIPVGIGYGDDVAKAMEIAQGVLDAEERILDEPATLIAVDALGDNAVNVLIRGWTQPGDFFATKLDLTRRIKEAFDDAGIGIPFPQRDLHLIQDGPIRVEQVG